MKILRQDIEHDDDDNETSFFLVFPWLFFMFLGAYENFQVCYRIFKICTRHVRRNQGNTRKTWVAQTSPRWLLEIKYQLQVPDTLFILYISSCKFY